MGDCVSANQVIVDFEENKDHLDLPHNQNTDTYDPGNMSTTRDSNMAGYQFTKKRKSTNDNQTPIQLSPIQDTKMTKCTVNYTNTSGSTIPTPRKRAVFVSLRSLNACIESIPSYILDESLFCLKAQRAWFFPSNAKEQKLSKQSIRHRSKFNDLFLKHLSKKDENNLILWLEDDKTWKDISNDITKIKDIYVDDTDTTKYYESLQLDVSWWMNSFGNDHTQALYCHSGDVVVEEIVEGKLKFNPTMELLYQSNPTLIPMKGFDIQMYVNQHYKEQEKDDTSLDIAKNNEAGAVGIGDNGDENVITLKDNDSAQNFNMVIIDPMIPITPFNEVDSNYNGVYNHVHKSNSKKQYDNEEDDENTENVVDADDKQVVAHA